MLLFIYKTCFTMQNLNMYSNYFQDIPGRCHSFGWSILPYKPKGQIDRFPVRTCAWGEGLVPDLSRSERKPINVSFSYWGISPSLSSTLPLSLKSLSLSSVRIKKYIFNRNICIHTYIYTYMYVCIYVYTHMCVYV